MIDLEIHLSDLDRQLIRLPVQFFEASEKSARKRHVYDEARRALERTVAELEGEARTEGVLPKITEGAVQNYIKGSPEYDAAVKDVNDARLEATLADGEVEAMRVKAKALDNLVRLYVANYFTDDSLSGQQQARSWDKDRHDAASGQARQKLSRSRKPKETKK